MVVKTQAHGPIEVPEWVVDFDSFGEWRFSDDVPEKLKAHYVRGRVWVEDMEEIFSHNKVKVAITSALDAIARTENLGTYFQDGVLLSNEAADVRNEPDAIFVSAESLKARRVTFKAGRRSSSHATMLVGSPDLVVEVVSPSSVDKDYEYLLAAYFDAGIREYWLIDARKAGAIAFTIHRRTSKGFAPVRVVRGWSNSDVFGRSFRLVRREQFGLADYVLESK
ncbi:MAG: Uma2 family endonuclease [Gemmataceae bacterium]|nr:Uma2 family endonuclease [Gemmataceae bacterium]